MANFLQGYIDNEINLSEKDTCTKSCSDFVNTEHQRCAPGTPCANQPEPSNPNICKGRIRDCQDVDHDDFFINYSNEANRRIQNLMYRNGEINGVKCSDSSCIAKSRVNTIIDIRSRIIASNSM